LPFYSNENNLKNLDTDFSSIKVRNLNYGDPGDEKLSGFFLEVREVREVRDER